MSNPNVLNHIGCNHHKEEVRAAIATQTCHLNALSHKIGKDP